MPVWCPTTVSLMPTHIVEPFDAPPASPLIEPPAAIPVLGVPKLAANVSVYEPGLEVFCCPVSDNLVLFEGLK